MEAGGVISVSANHPRPCLRGYLLLGTAGTVTFLSGRPALGISGLPAVHGRQRHSEQPDKILAATPVARPQDNPGPRGHNHRNTPVYANSRNSANRSTERSIAGSNEAGSGFRRGFGVSDRADAHDAADRRWSFALVHTRVGEVSEAGRGRRRVLALRCAGLMRGESQAAPQGQEAGPFTWTATAEEILMKVRLVQMQTGSRDTSDAGGPVRTGHL